MEYTALTYEGLEIYNNELTKSITALIAKGLPAGIITIWSGSANNIPIGWALCDGQNGTPDLSGKFVMGVSETHPENSVGGAETATLSVGNLPAHSHTVNGVTVTDNGKGGSLFVGGEAEISTGETTTTDTGEGDTFSILPPYYALAYIMKIA